MKRDSIIKPCKKVCMYGKCAVERHKSQMFLLLKYRHVCMKTLLLLFCVIFKVIFFLFVMSCDLLQKSFLVVIVITCTFDNFIH